MTATLCPTAAKPSLSKRGSKRLLRWLQEHRLDGPGRMSVYRCPSCHAEHLCHPDPKARKA